MCVCVEVWRPLTCNIKLSLKLKIASFCNRASPITRDYTELLPVPLDVKNAHRAKEQIYKWHIMTPPCYVEEVAT